jgi:hypothetical protein
MVIVFCEIDDIAACQLLSMLKTDRDLSGVEVVTCTSGWQKLRQSWTLH